MWCNFRMMQTLISLVVLLFLLHAEACEKRQTDNGFICVCNSTYCDKIPPIGNIENGLKVFYTTSTEPGFNVKELNFTDQRDSDAAVVRITNEKFQTIIGFGGAFTDSTGVNIKSLPEGAQKLLLESYFSDDGIEYNICRVPLGACDFSPRWYTLDDTENNMEDIELKTFNLQPEDLEYKIPMIQQALQQRGDKPLKLFSSPWTAPLWMKNRQVWSGYSELISKYYQAFADYHVKFFDEFLARGIQFWGMTIINEATAGFVDGIIASTGWGTAGQMDYVANYLGPTIRNSTNHKDLKIIIHDDNLGLLPFLVTPFLNDESTLKYIDGVGVHWYGDGGTVPEVRTLAKSDKKDIFVFNSEACHFITQPILGSWDRLNKYMDTIFTDLEWGYNAWVEWNLALNSSGGPSQINWSADAPIILSEDFTEFYKQPMFYGLGHFSKFVQPGSVRLGVEQQAGVRTMAFLRPDNLKVVVILNSQTLPVLIQMVDQGKFAPIEVPALSINTVIYNTIEL